MKLQRILAFSVIVLCAQLFSMNHPYLQGIDIRVGQVTSIDDIAKSPTLLSYKLLVDLGELGIKQAVVCPEFRNGYTKEALLNKYVLCIVNAPPKQIFPVRSEVIVLGAPGPNNSCILATIDRPVALGSKLY